MNLKVERIRKGLSQKELSKICGVSSVTIHKIETKGIEFVKIDTLKKIATALGKTIVELFFN